MRFVYFMQHELGFNTLALADDEYPTADRLPFMPYHRESRRIHGKVRFTLNHMTDPYGQAQPLYRTNIAVGDSSRAVVRLAARLVAASGGEATGGGGKVGVGV